MRKAFLLIPVLLCTWLVSCEGYSCASGVILDKETKLPLDSVYIRVLSDDDKSMYTDSTGKFSMCNGMGACFPDCKDIVVEFSKAGYGTVAFKEPHDSIFYLEPL
ncbi:hypothetical protein [Chitinophaga pinensis]|uniref:Carboxypeptidase regulatory-like domain-containing protein n=1 Tax=Chitinophaga pinensis TaxID=79329 RepID=A0A5C6LPY6_9BACT|nr:hypothetical protein [Chitinophaga pinensis]TWV97952.1 hypothetical protein FEF09_21250 [Chitinophaga pinensis]